VQAFHGFERGSGGEGQGRDGPLRLLLKVDALDEVTDVLRMQQELCAQNTRKSMRREQRRYEEEGRGAPV
jgi:hypothetical protein